MIPIADRPNVSFTEIKNSEKDYFPDRVYTWQQNTPDDLKIVHEIIKDVNEEFYMQSGTEQMLWHVKQSLLKKLKWDEEDINSMSFDERTGRLVLTVNFSSKKMKELGLTKRKHNLDYLP